MQRHIDAIQTPIPSMRIIICILGILHILTSCGWQEAKEQSNGTIKGNKGNDIGLPHGSHIPPTKVDIVKPDNLNY